MSQDRIDPEHEVLLANSVGSALLVVLETLAPAERLAFVLHDMFAVPFDEIAPSWAARRPQHGSSRAPPGAGCRQPPRLSTRISSASEKSSKPSSLPPRR
jgi:hypothetical protein